MQVLEFLLFLAKVLFGLISYIYNYWCWQISILTQNNTKIRKYIFQKKERVELQNHINCTQKEGNIIFNAAVLEDTQITMRQNTTGTVGIAVTSVGY